MSNEWRAVLGAAVDHIIDYRESLETRPHAPRLGYAEMREKVRARLPERGSDASAVLEELVELCDRVFVMVDGRITRELAGDELTTEQIEAATRTKVRENLRAGAGARA